MGGHGHLDARRRRRRWRRLGGVVATAAALTAAGGGSPPVGAQEADPESTPTRISLVHAVPGVDVDLVLDDEELASDFRLGEVRDVTNFAGRDLAGLRAMRAGSDLELGPVSAESIPADGIASVVVHLDETLSLQVTSFDDSAPAGQPGPGNGLLTVRHVAAAPVVDVVLDSTAQVRSLAPADGADFVVPAGPLGTATLTREGEPVFALPDVTIAEGRRTIVYVGGTAGEGNLVATVDTIPLAIDPPVVAEQSADGTPQPTLVDTGTLPVSEVPGVLLVVGLASLLASVAVFGLRRRLT